MAQQGPKNPKAPPPKRGKPTLRVVKTEPSEEKPKSKSLFVQMMQGFCDQLEQEIEDIRRM